LANWTNQLSDFTHFEPPGVCDVPGIRNTYDSPNWSGTEDEGASTYYDVYSDMKVPNLASGCGDTSSIGMCVGIGGDGAGHDQLLQNGVLAYGSPWNNWTYFWEGVNTIHGDSGAKTPAGVVSPGDRIQATT
jgi:hypothetical protein